MISRSALSFLVHLRLRLIACLRSPEAWLAFLIFGVGAAVSWPNSSNLSSLGEAAGSFSIFGVMFLWFWLWPAVLMVVIRGRATTGRGEAPLGTCPAPALPVGMRLRALSEATLALVSIGVVRWVLIAIYNSSWSVSAILPGFVVILLLFPMAVVWALPVGRAATFMLRPILIAIPAALFRQVGGVFDTWAGMVLSSLLLTALALLLAGFELPDLEGLRSGKRATLAFREGLDPARRLSGDSWRPLLRSWGGWFVLAVLIFGLCLYLDLRGRTVEWILFAGFEVFLIIGLQPLFRPFNSNMLAESLVGKRSVGRGDFLRAWSVLPVEPVGVLRRVWVHGMLCGLMLWAVPVMILILRHGLAEGFWSFRAGVGDLLPLLVIAALFVPIVAATLVAVAVGRRPEILISGLILIFGLQLLFMIRVFLVETLGRESMATDLVPILALVVMVVAGALPPLRFLFKAPEPS